MSVRQTYLPSLVEIRPLGVAQRIREIYTSCDFTSFLHGRSFRMCHEGLRAAPPGGEITMTSYPACNEISLSRKPCIPDKKNYYGTLSGSHGHSFRIGHDKVRAAPSGGGLTMTSYPVGNTTLLSRKPCIADIKLLWIIIMKSWSLILYYIKKTENIKGVSRSHKTANI